MKPDDTYEAPFQTDDEQTNSRNQSDLPDPADAAEVNAAKEAWEETEAAFSDDLEENEQLAQLAQPFVGQWNQLISTTNWEKGRIIGQWREALIESGADASQYSDDAWARRVGGVTAPHVGRLRRVHDRFASTYQTYEGIYWSHFLAALDWDDAPLWLEGSVREKWSVAAMREQRWQAHGAVESQRPTNSQIIEVDTDEDVVLPAQGGGRTKQYGDEPGVAGGPVYEDPDFGDEEERMSLSGSGGSQGSTATEAEAADGVQPFAGLPELPDDLADAFEALKLAILRHKTAGWESTDAATVQKYLDAFTVLMR
jgi:hypothetical protein